MNIFYTACVDINVENADSRHVIEVCENFSNSGHNVYLFVPKIKKYSGKTNVNIIYVVTPVKSIYANYLLFYFLLIPYVLLAYLKFKPDVLYSRYMATELIVAIVMKLLGCMYVVEVNGAFLDELRLKKKHSFLIHFLKLFENVLFSLADKIIVVTNGLKEYLNNTYKVNPSKVFVAKNGVNIDISRPLNIDECKKRLGLIEYKDYIIFVGSLQAWHGVYRLVEIVKCLSLKASNICLLVVGTGPEESKLFKQIVGEKLSDKILMIGEVNHEEIPYYIGSSKVCIAPYPDSIVSRHGFSSLKIREYMACGRPVVTTDVGGLYEFVEQNGCGIAVKANTEREITNAIMKILDEEQQWQRISERSRRFAVKYLSWGSTSKRIFSIIGNTHNEKMRTKKNVRVSIKG